MEGNFGGVIGEYKGRRRMHRYSKKFQLLPFGFDIPTINLIVFITRWLGGYKDKGRPPLQLVSTDSLKNDVATRKKKVRC